MRPGEIPFNQPPFGPNTPSQGVWMPYPGIIMPIGFFPRQQPQNSLSPVSQDILEKVDLRPSENFEQLTKQRLNLASSLASVNILESDKPQLVLAFGPNSSGKSTFLKQTKEVLEENGLSVVVFKSRLDGRGDDPNKAWTRNGDLPAIPVNHVSEIHKFLPLAKDHIIALDEAQLLGNPEELLSFVRQAKQEGYSIIADVLSRDLNGNDVTHLDSIINEASIGFELEAYDKIDPTKPADHTLLCVAITPQGNILDSNTSKGFYEQMSAQQRSNIANKVISIKNGHRFVVKKPEGFPNIHTAVLVPSVYESKESMHPYDRYIPVSRETLKQMFSAIGLYPPDIKPPKDFSQCPNIPNWESFDLGYARKKSQPVVFK